VTLKNVVCPMVCPHFSLLFYLGPLAGGVIYFYDITPDRVTATLRHPVDKDGRQIQPGPVYVGVNYANKKAIFSGIMRT
jgi:hypothetical protein